MTHDEITKLAEDPNMEWPTIEHETGAITLRNVDKEVSLCVVFGPNGQASHWMANDHATETTLHGTGPELVELPCASDLLDWLTEGEDGDWA